MCELKAPDTYWKPVTKGPWNWPDDKPKKKVKRDIEKREIDSLNDD